MRNVARGVGLGGSATLILACVMAAPAVAELKINVAPIHVETHVSPTIVHPPTPGVKTVLPQNSKSNLDRPSSVKADVLNSKSNPGGGNLISKDLDLASPSLWRGIGSAPTHADPSLRFTLSMGAGAHRNQLDDDAPTAPPDPDPAANSAGVVTAGGVIGVGVNQVKAGVWNIVVGAVVGLRNGLNQGYH